MGDERFSDGPECRGGDSLRESVAPLSATVADNSAGVYPTEEWEATYFSVSRKGVLRAHRTTVRVLEGLSAVCPPIRLGQPGCVYGVRRWGFVLRPSALEAAGFDPTPLFTTGDDADALRLTLRAAAFELPGEFVIASPEHPFRLLAADGILRGSWLWWRTYLGALSFFVSGGKVDAAFLDFWSEAEESYRLAVAECLLALSSGHPGPGPSTTPLPCETPRPGTGGIDIRPVLR